MKLFMGSMTGYGPNSESDIQEELTRTIDLRDVLVLPLASNGSRGGASIGTAVGVSAKNRRATITSTNIVADVLDDKRTFRVFTRWVHFHMTRIMGYHHHYHH